MKKIKQFFQVNSLSGIRYEVLIIEDNEGDAILAEEYLTEYLRDSELVRAKNFCLAAEILKDRKDPFDAIFLDLSLPDRSGADLVEAITDICNGAPVIVLTGNSDETFSITSLEMGVSDYLIKGEFNAFTLYKSLRYAIEKNRMHLELEAAHKTLVAAMDIARLGHWFYDTENARFRCSPEMCQILEQDEFVEFLGFRSYCALVHPDDLNDFQEGFFNAIRGKGVNELEHRVVLPGSGTKHIYLRGEPVFNGGNALLGIEGIIQDITTRKTQEEQKFLLESVITHAKDAVVITEAENTRPPGPAILYVNRAFTELTGYEPREVLGRSPRFLQGPDTSRLELDRLNRAMELQEPCRIEVINYHKNGTPYMVEMSVVPVKDSRGFCTHFISIERDVTERKEQELLLIELTQNLEKKVALRTEELESAHQLLHHHYTEIKESMVYAQTVQRAILATERDLQKYFSAAFVLSEPRDIVSGDFLWCHELDDNTTMVAVADCTGHGLHGALLSMIAHQLLNQSVKHKGLTDPSDILTDVHNELLRIYTPNEHMAHHYNGMDAGLIVFDKKNKSLAFSGARRHLYIKRSETIERIKGSKFTVGEAQSSQVDKSLKTRIENCLPGDVYYLTSDGFSDQFGGPDGRKLMNKGFEEALNKVAGLEFWKQQKALSEIFHSWKSGYDQTDDVLVAAIAL